MARLGLFAWIVALLPLAACTLSEGPRGEPIAAPRRHLLVEVWGIVEVDTGNPEVPSPRYAYSSVESFEVLLVAIADAVALSDQDHLPYDAQKRAALEHAQREVAGLGGCLKLVDARAETAGWAQRPRFSTIKTATGEELHAEQLAGLCTGGPLP